MPSRIDEAGHTKAFGYPVAEHWGESQRTKRSLVGFEPTSVHTYGSEIQRSTTYAIREEKILGIIAEQRHLVNQVRSQKRNNHRRREIWPAENLLYFLATVVDPRLVLFVALCDL